MELPFLQKQAVLKCNVPAIIWTYLTAKLFQNPTFAIESPWPSTLKDLTFDIITQIQSVSGVWLHLDQIDMLQKQLQMLFPSAPGHLSCTLSFCIKDVAL